MQEQTFVNYKKNAYELGVERLRSMELVEIPRDTSRESCQNASPR